MPVPTRYIDAGPALPHQSVSNAAAPGLASAKIGDAIASIGEQGMRVVEGVRKAKDAGQISSWFANKDAEAAKFSNSLMTRQDPDNWVQDWTGHLSEYRSELDQLDVSPAGKQQAEQEFVQWSTRRSIGFETQAATRAVQEGKARLSNTIKYYAETGDADSMKREVKRGVESGLVPKSEEEAVMRDADRIASTASLQREIITNSKAAGDKINSPEFRSSKTPAELNRYDAMLADQQRIETYNTVERFNNGVLDGTINKPEQVEKMFPNASGSLKRRMIDDLNHEVTDEERRARQTPEYQQAISGRVSAMLDGYKPNMAGFDEDYYSMDRMIRTLPESEMKARLNFRLDQARKDQQDEWKDNADPYRARFKEDYQGGAFGYGSVKKPIQEIVADGILSDTGKLMARGMSEQQANIVKSGKADAGDLKAMGFSDAEAEKLAGMTGITGQIELFRALDDKRQGFENPDTPVYEREALDAIKTGKKGFVEYPDRKANEAAERKYGEALTAWEKWYRVNPKATPEQMDKKYFEIVKPTGTDSFRESLLGEGVRPPKPR